MSVKAKILKLRVLLSGDYEIKRKRTNNYSLVKSTQIIDKHQDNKQILETGINVQPNTNE